MRKKKINWRKGTGEFIGFTIASIGLVTFLIMIISVSLLDHTSEMMENAVSEIGRQVVTCDSIEEAREDAQIIAEYVLEGNSTVVDGSVEADVEYSVGADAQWQKGNYITVYLSAELDNMFPSTSGTKEVSAILMIENSGSGD